MININHKKKESDITLKEVVYFLQGSKIIEGIVIGVRNSVNLFANYEDILNCPEKVEERVSYEIRTRCKVFDDSMGKTTTYFTRKGGEVFKTKEDLINSLK